VAPTKAVSQTMIVSSYGTPSHGSAERFFQWSLYLLLVTGFVALMGTNKLDLPSLALVIPALVFRGYLLLMRKMPVISERWTTYLTLVYFIFYAADYFYFSQSFINATVHLVLFIMVIKIFSVRRDRDLVYLAVISFLMLLAAAVLTVDTMFLAAFSLFIVVSIATFVSMEMRRSERELMSVSVPAHMDGRFQRSLAAAASLLGTFTLLGAALIFFVLPRINSAGYLRNFGVQGAMLSGFSQEVRLGGIGQIQQSSAVVMHVQVLYGKLPRDVKWRGISLANFDGQRWWNAEEDPVTHGLNNVPLDLIQLNGSAFYSGAAPPPRLPTFSYRVVMEPTGLPIFFLAPVPTRLNGNYRMVELTRDGAVYNRHGVVTRNGLQEADNAQAIGVYTAEADARDPEIYIRNSNSRDYPPRVATLYLQLPHIDPRVAALAQRITASADSNYARAREIENYLKKNYGYTLQLPGGRTPDPLAYFLFQRKKGHCEYFASSMTVMLRTLGIPARVVNGFRGGEYNDLTGSYIVREKNAHSWVEGYFPEFGWVTFDPTPASDAPMETSTWSRFSMYMDAASELWREWVVNYDFSHQMKLSADISASTGHAQVTFRSWLAVNYTRAVRLALNWEKWLSELTPQEMANWCVVLGLLLALPFIPKAWRTFERRRKARDPQQAPRTAASFWYLRMLKRVARRGFRKEAAQTPGEFAESIADPEIRDEVVTFTQHYERARFAESVEDAARLPELFEEMLAKK
jgi:protein-glutamine gamma-glutamyltransferase